MNNFYTYLFDITGNTTSGLSERKNNGNEEVLHTSQIFRTGISPLVAGKSHTKDAHVLGRAEVFPHFSRNTVDELVGKTDYLQVSKKYKSNILCKPLSRP